MRKTQDLTIQEAFIDCLDEAGISTSEFREAIMKINNYGIINNGEIKGDAKADNIFSQGANVLSNLSQESKKSANSESKK